MVQNINNYTRMLCEDILNDNHKSLKENAKFILKKLEEIKIE